MTMNMFRNINVIALWTARKRREVDECLTRKEAKWYADERSSAEEQPLIFKVVFTNTVSIKDNKHSTSVTNIARSSRVYKKSSEAERIILFEIFNSSVHIPQIYVKKLRVGLPQRINELIRQRIFPKLSYLPILRFISWYHVTESRLSHKTVM